MSLFTPAPNNERGELAPLSEPVDIREFIFEQIKTYDNIDRRTIIDIAAKIRKEFNLKNRDRVIHPFHQGSTLKTVALKTVLDRFRYIVFTDKLTTPDQIIEYVNSPPTRRKKRSKKEDSPPLSEKEEEVLSESSKEKVLSESLKATKKKEEEEEDDGKHRSDARISLPARSKPAPPLSEKEVEDFGIQSLKRDLIRKVTGSKYLGSGTPLVKFLKTGERPANASDAIAMEHDIRYSTATTPEEVQEADRIFIERMNALVTSFPSVGDTILSTVAGTAMSLKTFVDRLVPVSTESAFVDFEENERRPERKTLLKIQEKLERAETLDDASIDFIFTPQTKNALLSPPPLLLKGEEEESEPSEEEEKREELRTVRDFMEKLEDEEQVVDIMNYLQENRPDLYEALLAKEALNLKDSNRKGHVEAVSQELILQQLKKEEEDRQMSFLRNQNDVDDYMANPVPNHYLRPMFATEWLDIAKLQRYQTPEYVKAEKKIWERNWQTPFQYGEGTVDNSIKDVQNMVERLAALEHHIRYNLASKGLQKDQVNPGFNYAEPMKRTGAFPTSRSFPDPELERYEFQKKKKMSASKSEITSRIMSRYQYMQRQNQPPRTKPINREQVFGSAGISLTRDSGNAGQQRIYDEMMTESLPRFDIQNDFDRAYYDRRIRRQR